MTAVSYWPPDTQLPDGTCPGCRSPALTAWQDKCQACGVLQGLACAPHTAVGYRDLSHGQPGHRCVLPPAAQRQHQAEAGQ